jgi:hypothetical protein
MLEAIGGSCAQCHSRLLPDGAVLKGAPSDVPFEQNLVALNRQRGFGPATVARLHDIEWLLSGAPWITPRETFDRSFSVDDWIRRHRTMPAGVLERQGTSSTHPTRIPSLIGIERRRGPARASGIETVGGRVMRVTAGCVDLPAENALAYDACGRIHFEGLHYILDTWAKDLRS